MGTDREDFVTLVQRISRKTGGIRTSMFNSVINGSDQAAARLFLRCKAMLPQVQELLAILKDVLLTARLDNRERFKQMVLEEKAQMEQRLIPAGSQMVEMRLRSCFNEADWAEEQMKGVSYLLFLRGLANAVESDWQGVLAVLEDLRGKLVNAGATIANVTLDEKSWSGCEQHLRAFLDALPHAALPHLPGCRSVLLPMKA